MVRLRNAFPLRLFMLCVFFNEHVMPMKLKIMRRIQWAWAVSAALDWLVKKLSCSWKDIVKVKPRRGGPLIHSQLSDLSIWVEGNTSLVVFWVLQTHTIWNIWKKIKKSEHSLSGSLPFARFQELCSGERQWLECIPSSPISKDTHQVSFCTSGQ